MILVFGRRDAIVGVHVGPAAAGIVAAERPARACRCPLEREAAGDSPVRGDLPDDGKPLAGAHPRGGGDTGRCDRQGETRAFHSVTVRRASNSVFSVP